MRKLLLTLLALVLVFGVAFSAKYVVGLSLSTLNNPFFVTLRDGAVEAAEKLGIELIVLDAQDNPAKQLNDIEDLIQKKVDLIIVNPTDSDAIVSAVESANEAGIPVITVDRASNGGKVVCHIASDNVEGGRMAARYIAKVLNGKGKVVELVGIPGTSAARDRGKGFEEELAKYPGLQLVAKQTANFNRAEGLTVMENILEAHPDIDAVFAQNDEMALGAIEAIKAAGKLDDIIVVGFDAIPDAIEAIKKGEMEATIAQQPYLMGQLAVTKAFEYLTTGTVFFPVELKLVTTENVE
ncbi:MULTISPECIES: ribose ABC transporter substrate-binding protein RbsB [Thermotoga]|uniref:Periplasmic binding protein/LacI transcriptional regulator n=2 Tax=Thermotoga petrophila TaxID=93929 RepID=D2C551_THEP2|nr:MULTISPECIES: ribose ABC transporter substrate-binding protein RbsB [Thermotoga]KUK22681.1 MAG: Monosaccharide-transporting ATPase [Thermotoga petrophila]ADA67855.1 periplasmic binding protein/LacI transcriptional regulator [Thermotoga petrophila RKU-10]AIY89043.1 periplasmic binding protein/LacI transcriptional regulator [Thermotoga sp. Cell2]KHC93214.1 periplasmic binding protein/LacI transcriptional regulator [Thermotoga sp. TBGT1765]KHC94622.1 periplasmic binding protein/LacI transcript